MMDRDALDSLYHRAGESAAWWGVTVGVVTNNRDPDHNGRVKLKVPTLSQTAETTWAPVLTLSASAGSGLHLLPQVGDAVLVAFEHGDANRPYVLGSFWSTKQKPPETSDDAGTQQVLRSTSGHEIRLSDRSGEERIEIVDSNAKHRITLDTANNNITIHGGGTVTIAADGDLEVTAKGELKLSGQRVTVEGELELSLSAKQRTEVRASGQLILRGGTVDIN